MNELLQAALEFAEMGLFVLPLKPGEKNPDTPHGLYDATVNLNRVEKWWREKPERNIGIAMGHGILTLDFDVDETKNGLEIKRAWELKHGKELPATWICGTPRGGSHWMYRDPFNRKKHLDLYSGVDLLACGSYTVVPPSRRNDGTEYFWKCFKKDLPLGVVDETVEEFLIGDPEKQNAKEETKRKVQNHVERIASSDLQGIVKEGSRTKKMMKLIGRLIWNDLCNDSIQAVVEIENALRFDPPFTDAELESTILPALNRGWKASSPYWIDQEIENGGGQSWKKKETSVVSGLTKKELRELYQKLYQAKIVENPEQFVEVIQRFF